MDKQHFIIPIFVPHKGCPHDCVFCNQKKITGQEEAASDDEIKAKIEAHLATIALASSSQETCVEIAFYGGSFTAIPIGEQVRHLSIAFEYVESKQISNIRISTRPDCITDEILINLKKYAVTTVELGVQSMDETVLVMSNRGHTAEDVHFAIKKLKAYGFIVGVQVMVGLPGDSHKTCMDTVNKLVDMKPDIARIYPTLTIKNTCLEALYQKGLYKPYSLDETARICKDMLAAFEANHIDVIRIGLQPTENILTGKDVIAGPFHPSMRQIVESLIYRDIMIFMLDESRTAEKELVIQVHPKAVSVVIGQKKSNLVYLKNKYAFDKIQILQQFDMDKDQVVLKFGEYMKSLTKNDYYNIMARCRN